MDLDNLSYKKIYHKNVSQSTQHPLDIPCQSWHWECISFLYFVMYPYASIGTSGWRSAFQTVGVWAVDWQ